MFQQVLRRKNKDINYKIQQLNGLDVNSSRFFAHSQIKFVMCLDTLIESILIM